MYSGNDEVTAAATAPDGANTSSLIANALRSTASRHRAGAVRRDVQSRQAATVPAMRASQSAREGSTSGSWSANVSASRAVSPSLTVNRPPMVPLSVSGVAASQVETATAADPCAATAAPARHDNRGAWVP
jgi:hypothetical protein